MCVCNPQIKAIYCGKGNCKNHIVAGRKLVSDLLACDVCNTERVYVKGELLAVSNRLVCPQCAQNALDDIKRRLQVNKTNDTDQEAHDAK